MPQITGSRPAEAEKISIGILSRQSGVNIETIRYYEKIKLLRPPGRTTSGRRMFGQTEVRTLSFIRRARELGFTLLEIRTLLRLVEGGFTCGEVQELTERHLGDVRRKISDLRRIERTLSAVSQQCVGGAVPDCPIVDALLR